MINLQLMRMICGTAGSARRACVSENAGEAERQRTLRVDHDNPRQGEQSAKGEKWLPPSDLVRHQAKVRRKKNVDERAHAVKSREECARSLRRPCDTNGCGHVKNRPCRLTLWIGSSLRGLSPALTSCLSSPAQANG